MSQARTSSPFGEMVDAVADIQRRRLLVALLEHSPREDTPTVVAGPGSETNAFERRVSMNQVHLPKLVEYGFIARDEENHEISRGPNFDSIRPLLELLDDHADELPADWI